MRRLPWAAFLAVALGAAAATAGADPVLVAPSADAAARVRWSTAAPESAIAPDTTAAVLATGQRGPAGPARARAFAERLAAAGDTLRADSVLASRRITASVWAWRALARREAFALSAGDTARARRLMESADRGAWPEGDRAAWLAERARLAAVMGDTLLAEDLARQAIRVYPSLAPAADALNLLDQMARARADSLSAADERSGAEVDYFRAQRASAAARLRRALPRTDPAGRWRVALRLAEVLRESRSPQAARAAADTAEWLAPDDTARARAQLERARALRDGRATDAAFALYRDIAAHAPEAAIRASAWWELAREAQDRGRYAEARDAFARSAGAAGRRGEDARLQAGLMCFVLGQPDSALAWWRGGGGEPTRFWYGVTLRGRDRAAGDSVLRALAVRPGYTFYRAAARDTLGTRGWPGSVAAARCPGDSACAVLWAADSLAREGLGEDAAFLLSRWAAGDARLAGAGRGPGVDTWLMAARLAYAGGAASTATRHAERAFAAAGESDSLAWAVVPWAYPPAFESQVAAAESLGIEPALLWGLLRQESRFDPRARSRSNALGLAQLLMPTAGDVARWLRDPPPTEERLFDPEIGVRYGARYLAWLLRRFDGQEAVALAAYNAGPGTIRRDWRDLLARGGAALFCELASNADSQDYARRILGMRQAYRELRPTTAP